MKRSISLGLALWLAFATVRPGPTAIVAASTPPPPHDGLTVAFEIDGRAISVQAQRVGDAWFSRVVGAGSLDSAPDGEPMLPKRGVLVAIPPNASPTLRVVFDDDETVPLRYPLERAPLRVAERAPGAAQLNPRDIEEVSAVSWLAPGLVPNDAVRIRQVGQWRSQHFALIDIAPVQYRPTTEELIIHRRIRVVVDFGVAQPTGGSVDEGEFEPIFARAFLNYEDGRAWRAQPQPDSLEDAAYSGGPWLKIGVTADGLYDISCAALEGAGVDMTTVDPATWRLFKDGSELAIDVAGLAGGCAGGGRISFYGLAARSQYTDTNVYWLTYGGPVGRRMAQRPSAIGGTLNERYRERLHLERDVEYRPFLPYVEDADHWYWRYIQDPGDGDGNGDVRSADFPFAVDAVATTEPVTLSATLMGFNNQHRTQLLVNGQLVADQAWSGQIANTITATFSGALLSDITNTIRVSEGVPLPSAIFVNGFDLEYGRALVARSNALRFSQDAPGAWRHRVTGFTSGTPDVYDISDPASVARITDASYAGGAIEFGDAGARSYLALTPGAHLTPAGIALDTPSDLRSAANGADYLVISHHDFLSAIQPLAALRAGQGYRVKLVDVQDIYDEFSDGVFDPQAIHAFLQYAYEHWQAPAPTYVVLVGDGTLDFKNNWGVGDANFIPPYRKLVDPWNGLVASDNRLVTFHLPNTMPDMMIGRLPANSPADAAAMVAKIVAYDATPPLGAWRTRVTFVADNAYFASGASDRAGNFWAKSEEVAGDPALMPPRFQVQRIYYNPCTNTAAYPQCALPFPSYPTDSAVRAALQGALNEGRLFINFVGHAWFQGWGDEDLLTLDQINAQDNAGRNPIVLSMTCYDGYFDFPGLPSLAETNVRLAGRGAVAAWSPTGLGIATGHDYLDRGFFGAVADGAAKRLGPATVAGKLNLWLNSGGLYRDLIDTYTIFGDPATRFAFGAASYMPLVRR